MWEATFDEDSDTECGAATPANYGGPVPTSRMVASMDANPDMSNNSTLSQIYNNNQMGSILSKDQNRQLRYSGTKDTQQHWRFVLAETIAAKYGDIAAKLISECTISALEWQSMSADEASYLVKLNKALYPELLGLIDNSTSEGKTIMSEVMNALRTGTMTRTASDLMEVILSVNSPKTLDECTAELASIIKDCVITAGMSEPDMRQRHEQMSTRFRRMPAEHRGGEESLIKLLWRLAPRECDTYKHQLAKEMAA